VNRGIRGNTDSIQPHRSVYSAYSALNIPCSVLRKQSAPIGAIRVKTVLFLGWTLELTRARRPRGMTQNGDLGKSKRSIRQLRE